MTLVKVDLKNPDTLGMEVVYWEDVREKTKRANPMLAALIDEADPGKKYPLVLAKYPYGVNIHRQGRIFLPVANSSLATLDDPAMPNEIKKLLNYSTCPVGLVLDKSTEVYIESSEGRSIPFKLFSPGTSFGVWEMLDSPSMLLRREWEWNITSGARTTFILPSTNDSRGFSNLKKDFNLKSYSPKTIFDQHKVFSEIVRHADTNWCTEILFFPNDWLGNDNLGFAMLKQHWQSEAWKQIQHWASANSIAVNYSWELFMLELNNLGVKPKSYILDTVKHLFSIGSGTIPGFRLASKDELALPVGLIQNAYVESYGLKYYYPGIMHPSFLDFDKKKDYVYYSLQYPTLPEKPAKFSSFPSVLKMTRELKSIMDIYLDLSHRWPRAASDPSLDFLEHIKFDYFHSEKDQAGEIDTLDRMFAEDASLRPSNEAFGPRIYPESAHFFRGCVRVGFHRDAEE